MATEQVVLLLAVFMASVSLIKLMRKRQIHLTGLLRQHVERQKEWAQKRARAASIALQAAKSKEKTLEQQATTLTEFIDASQNASPSTPTVSTEVQSVTQ